MNKFLYEEYKNCLETSFKNEWAIYKSSIYKKIAILLQENHPDMSETELIDFIENKKCGRPKIRENPFAKPTIKYKVKTKIPVKYKIKTKIPVKYKVKKQSDVISTV